MTYEQLREIQEVYDLLPEIVKAGVTPNTDLREDVKRPYILFQVQGDRGSPKSIVACGTPSGGQGWPSYFGPSNYDPRGLNQCDVEAITRFFGRSVRYIKTLLDYAHEQHAHTDRLIRTHTQSLEAYLEKMVKLLGADCKLVETIEHNGSKVTITYEVVPKE